MAELVQVERDGALARVWLNRPEVHNALSPDLADAITRAMRALAEDSGVRCVVLGGRGASFCAGADIAAMRASGGASFDANLAEAGRLGELFAAVAEFPRPVVARVHGGVYGGGVGLACAADVAVAADDARFGLTEVRLGILPALISPYVMRRLGDRVARELMLSGERFDAAAAGRYGVVQHVAAAGALDEAVADRTAALLAGGPEAQARIKEMLVRWHEQPWEAYRAGLPRTIAEARAGAEAREGLSAFLEKRPPAWTT